MTYEMNMREFRDEGYHAGFETGLQTGENKERIQSARDFIARGLISFDDIKATGRYSSEEFSRYPEYSSINVSKKQPYF